MAPSEACNGSGSSSLLALQTLSQGFSLIVMKGLRWVHWASKKEETLSCDHFRREEIFPELSWVPYPSLNLSLERSMGLSSSSGESTTITSLRRVWETGTLTVEGKTH